MLSMYVKDVALIRLVDAVFYVITIVYGRFIIDFMIDYKMKRP